MFIVFGLLSLIIFLLFSYFFPWFYISELLLSFTPHIILFSFLGLLWSIVLIKNKKIGEYLKIIPLFIFLFSLLFFLFSRKLNNFYNWSWFLDIKSINSWENYGTSKWLDILYSNILYKNQDYTGLVDWIRKDNPDIVLMVEFTNDHYQNMKEILHDEYPYSAINNFSKKYFGNVVFSKYPITDLSYNIDQWAWRYSYFQTKYNNQNYYIYLVHTSSPITYSFFDMRNNQFDIIKNDFIKHKEDISLDDKIIMLWDFNVSPRSVYYKNLENSLIGLNNLTKNFKILFTWRIKFIPFLTSHIDHVFVSDNVFVENIIKVKTPNSDHRWFFISNFR